MGRGHWVTIIASGILVAQGYCYCTSDPCEKIILRAPTPKPEPQPILQSTYVEVAPGYITGSPGRIFLMSCRLCGAAVINGPAHQEWHKEVIAGEESSD